MSKSYKSEIKFSENEYISLRTELVERIKLLNSQSFTVLATVVSFWAIGFTFKAQILNKISDQNIIQQIFINFLSAVIFLIPIFLFIPLSAKSGENLLQIASLSAYIKVFYDYPVSKNKINKNWETSNNLLSNSNINRGKKSKGMKLYNDDYTILSIISFFIYIICAILQIYELKLYYSRNKIIMSVFCGVVIIYLFIATMAVFSIRFIHKVSSLKNTLMKGTLYYTQAYIKRANELGVINDRDVQNAILELNPLKEMRIVDYFK